MESNARQNPAELGVSNKNASAKSVRQGHAEQRALSAEQYGAAKGWKTRAQKNRWYKATLSFAVPKEAAEESMYTRKQQRRARSTKTRINLAASSFAVPKEAAEESMYSRKQLQRARSPRGEHKPCSIKLCSAQAAVHGSMQGGMP
eukprot:417057-Pelagomonas_calceolata.AAC.3